MTQIQVLRGSTALWASINPVLADGEIGIDSTTGVTKIGNGVSAWNVLLPFAKVTSVSAGAGLVGGGDTSQNRSLAVAFAGTGIATTAARSDHDHPPTAYVNLTLNSGGGFVVSTVTPQVRAEGGRAYCAGRINGPMANAVTVATIPVGYRPAASGAGGPSGLDFYGFIVPCGTGTANVRVYPSGAVSVFAPNPSGTQSIDLSTMDWPIA